VASHPADIRSAPVNVIITKVEDILCRCVNPDQITACRVQNSLRFSGRTAGIKNVKRVLAIKRDWADNPRQRIAFRGATRRRGLLNIYFVTGAPKYDHSLDRCSAAQCVVDVFL
jgi:hypothetical protein